MRRFSSQTFRVVLYLRYKRNHVSELLRLFIRVCAKDVERALVVVPLLQELFFIRLRVSLD